MQPITVAINGFGRIGRAFFKSAITRNDITIAAINDLGDIENLAYLLKYDSAYGHSGLEVSVSGSSLIVNGKTIPVLSIKDPAQLPWGMMHIDVVVEATGHFEEFATAKVHITSGAKRVVITAPAKDDPAGDLAGGTILMGVNNEALAKTVITSNASCTTNAGSPLLAILNQSIGIEKAILNTVHAYTATQSIVDGPVKGKDFRRGRAGAHNIVPSSTGAAIAVTKALPELSGKFDGISIRVPVVTGSLVDITFISSRPTTVVEINNALTAGAASPRWAGIFGVTTEQLVSSDIIGTPLASIADLSFTRVVGGNLVKVLAWYDNEAGYVSTLVRHVVEAGSTLRGS